MTKPSIYESSQTKRKIRVSLIGFGWFRLGLKNISDQFFLKNNLHYFFGLFELIISSFLGPYFKSININNVRFAK